MSNIASVIKQRVAMQSTGKNLEEKFKIKTPTLDYFQSKSFQSIYNQWTEEMKKDFVILVGGKINFKTTKNFIEHNI